MYNEMEYQEEYRMADLIRRQWLGIIKPLAERCRPSSDPMFKYTVHHSDQSIRCHELRIDHGCSKLLAQQTETDVRHIFHRGQKDRIWTKFDISNFHNERKNTKKQGAD